MATLWIIKNRVTFIWLLGTFIYTPCYKAKADLIFWVSMQTTRGVKNFFILLLAPVLALGLFLIMQDLWGMTASVLDFSELKRIKEQERDLAYKTENQLFELFWTESLYGTELNFELLYNPEKIQLSTDLATGAAFRVLAETPGQIQFVLLAEKSRSVQEGWFQIPFSGEENQLLLWEAAKLTPWGLQPLRVGSLNQHDQHSFLP